MSEVTALREQVFALEVAALAHKELVQDLLNENDELKNALDGKKFELINFEKKQQEDSRDDLHVIPPEQLDNVDFHELHKWQARAMTAEQSVQDAQDSMQSNNFVLALIDGNHHSFPLNLLLKGIEGGAEVADRLFNEIKTHTQGWTVADWKIMARIYVDAEGLRNKYRGLPKQLGQWDLIQFAQGFNQRQPLFDFVETGSESAIGCKLEETFKSFIDNIQCQHIIYGCRIDHKSLRLLEQYKENVLAASRISLLGPAKVGWGSGFNKVNLIGAISYEGLSKTKFLTSDSGSSDTALDRLSTAPPTEQQMNSATEKATIAVPEDDENFPIYRFSDRKASPNNGTIGYLSGKRLRKVPMSSLVMDSPQRKFPSLVPKTWGPDPGVVLININNERVDADLGPVDLEAARKLASWTKGQKLCHNYILLGRCAHGESCTFTHTADLDEKEKVALMYRARQLLCARGSDCRSIKCWSGHMCAPTCKQGVGCFKKLHHVDRTAVKVWQPGSK